MRRLLSLIPRRRPTVGPPSGGTAGPAAGLTPQHRAERRAVARRLHPDLGGDVEEYLAALALVDRRHGPAPGRGAERPSVPRSWDARRSRLRRRAGRVARAARERLPRHVPGARRYARL